MKQITSPKQKEVAVFVISRLHPAISKCAVTMLDCTGDQPVEVSSLSVPGSLKKLHDFFHDHCIVESHITALRLCNADVFIGDLFRDKELSDSFGFELELASPNIIIHFWSLDND